MSSEGKALIDRYEAGADKIAQAIRNLTLEDLLTVPEPGANVGKWSIQQVVIHVCDADTAFADRIRRLIAEDNPMLQAWDENRFVQRLHYDKQSAFEAAEMINLMRQQILRILRATGESVLTRKGVHSERGPMTLFDTLKYATDHLEHHLKFIHDKRANMGKEMW